MKGGWTCKECCHKRGLVWQGASHVGGYCAGGRHNTHQTIRWTADLEVGDNPARVMAAHAGMQLDVAAVEELAAKCEERVPMGTRSIDDNSKDQMSLF